jgi:hypothetical protein
MKMSFQLIPKELLGNLVGMGIPMDLKEIGNSSGIPLSFPW